MAKVTRQPKLCVICGDPVTAKGKAILCGSTACLDERTRQTRAAYNRANRDAIHAYESRPEARQRRAAAARLKRDANPASARQEDRDYYKRTHPNMLARTERLCAICGCAFIDRAPTATICGNPACDRERTRLRAEQKRHVGLAQPMCQICGDPITGRRVDAKCCVKRECQKISKRLGQDPVIKRASNIRWAKEHPDLQLAAVRAWGRAHPDKRRESSRKRHATKRAAFVAPVDEREIFARDGWRCQASRCLAKSRRVSKTRRWPDPLASSLDHIIPLAEGGTHEPANVQLTHLICNMSKNDRATDDQLRLL